MCWARTDDCKVNGGHGGTLASSSPTPPWKAKWRPRNAAASQQRPVAFLRLVLSLKTGAGAGVTV
ncbi:hypothetical protein CTA1_12907 [Colletotrichum tanaceti]|uniref:Uncharacterized protein n=1 Tax=Colletotrichum tanaceti TaxID=1306861 RepID=A0A4U6X5V9_9PEZI|nr:hypothetical protein CTA1_12907 [Colletotrichum tanaceti]